MKEKKPSWLSPWAASFFSGCVPFSLFSTQRLVFFWDIFVEEPGPSALEQSASHQDATQRSLGISEAVTAHLPQADQYSGTDLVKMAPCVLGAEIVQPASSTNEAAARPHPDLSGFLR